VAVRRVTRGAVGNGQGRNMHTTITCIRLYPGMAISAASRISFVGLWRPGRWGLIVCIIFFLSRLARCIAYCEGFARFAGKASDAWAWVVVWLGMFCVFGKTAWDYVHWGLGVNGPNMVKHYFSAKFSAQRPSTVVRRFYLILESGCVSSVHTHQPCHFFWWGQWLRSQRQSSPACTSYPLCHTQYEPVSNTTQSYQKARRKKSIVAFLIQKHDRRRNNSRSTSVRQRNKDLLLPHLLQPNMILRWDVTEIKILGEKDEPKWNLNVQHECATKHKKSLMLSKG
jgi:hypothetical protein